MGLDDDDPTHEEAQFKLWGTPNTRCFVRPRHESLPHLQNFLASQAKGDFILPLSDDYVIEQEDWVELVEAALAKLPGGYGIVHLHDPVYSGFATFPVIPRKVMEMQGWLMAPFFPFLFTDTWWDEVGTLSGIKLRSDASVALDNSTGHDHRYCDLRLWADLFDVLRPLRVQLALDMLRHIRGLLEPDVYERIVQTMPQRAGGCAAFHARWTSDDELARIQGMGTYEPGPRYLAMKAKAVRALPELRAAREAA